MPALMNTFPGVVMLQLVPYDGCCSWGSWWCLPNFASLDSSTLAHLWTSKSLSLLSKFLYLSIPHCELYWTETETSARVPHRMLRTRASRRLAEHVIALTSIQTSHSQGHLTTCRAIHSLCDWAGLRARLIINFVLFPFFGVFTVVVFIFSVKNKLLLF